MHASDTALIAFQDVRVPESAVLGQIGKGFYHIMWELQGERLIGAAGCVAGAQHVFDRTLQYAKERKAFGRSIGHFQVIRHKFAEMATKIETARQLVYTTAWRFQNGEYPVREISMAKLHAARVAVEVADECIQIHGGAGYMKEYGVERSWRDMRPYRVGAGTVGIVAGVVAIYRVLTLAQSLLEIDGVTEVYSVAGPFDLVAVARVRCAHGDPFFEVGDHGRRQAVGGSVDDHTHDANWQPVGAGDFRDGETFHIHRCRPGVPKGRGLVSAGSDRSWARQQPAAGHRVVRSERRTQPLAPVARRHDGGALRRNHLAREEDGAAGQRRIEPPRHAPADQCGCARVDERARATGRSAAADTAHHDQCSVCEACERRVPLRRGTQMACLGRESRDDADYVQCVVPSRARVRYAASAHSGK